MRKTKTFKIGTTCQQLWRLQLSAKVSNFLPVTCAMARHAEKTDFMMFDFGLGFYTAALLEIRCRCVRDLAAPV